MNKKQILIIALTMAGIASAALHTGEAVVAAQVGRVETRVLTDTVHQGKTERKKLSEGSSVGESARVMTGKDGWVCMVLSPGAILCIAPKTEVTFRQLRHSANGLPKSEDDLIRRIHLDLHKGRILVHAAAPTPSLDIRIRIDGGELEAQGGSFVVAQTDQKEWALISEEYEQFVTPAGAERTVIPAGEALQLTLSDAGRSRLENRPDLLESKIRHFEICNCYFDDLETFIHDPLDFDRKGLSRYIGGSGGVEFFGSVDFVTDVSPSIRRVVSDKRRTAPSPGVRAGDSRWDPQRAWRWYENIGVIKGVNYIPRNAVNSTAMWMEEIFDKELIDEELGWAKKAGYTTLRVQLQYVVWKEDEEAFLDRLDEFLDLAERHDLNVVFVLFDDKNLAGIDPVAEPQPDPVPGRHNARWTPSPGVALVMDRAAWPDLERYVQGVIDEFKHDDRVLYWDLYNRTGDNDLWEKTLPMMDQTFNWARDIHPDQPLAVAAWTRLESAMSARMLERSDIVTFQSFESVEQVEALLMLLNRYERPVICSDWLMRPLDNTFEKLLPLFAIHRVGWFNRGLVKGKTQEWIQQEKFRSETNPDLWQHDVLETDGDAYDADEIELIQEFRFYNN